jgi:hypothetical protein
MEEDQERLNRVFTRRSEVERRDREAIEALEMLRRPGSFVVIGLPAPSTRRISELLGLNLVRPPTPRGLSPRLLVNTYRIRRAFDLDQVLPPMTIHDLNAISALEQIMCFVMTPWRRKKKVKFAHPSV